MIFAQHSQSDKHGIRRAIPLDDDGLDDPILGLNKNCWNEKEKDEFPSPFLAFIEFFQTYDV